MCQCFHIWETNCRAFRLINVDKQVRWGRKIFTFEASHETSFCRCFAFADFRGCSSCNNGGSAAWAADLAVSSLCRGLLAVVCSWKTLYFLIRGFRSMEMCTMLELDFYYNNCNIGGSAAWAADLTVRCLCRSLLAVDRSPEPLYFLIRAFCFAWQSMLCLQTKHGDVLCTGTNTPLSTRQKLQAVPGQVAFHPPLHLFTSPLPLLGRY